MPLRILLVDDSFLFRQGVRTALQEYAKDVLEVAGEVGTVEEAVACCGTLRPDLVMTEMRLPDGSGAALCTEITRKYPKVRILALTSSQEDALIQSAVAAGVCGYLLKDVGLEELVDSIQRVARGESVVSPALTARVLALVKSKAPPSTSSFTLLSRQERRIVELVARGLTNKEIAEQLNLSDNTVKNYLSRCFQKLGVQRRSEAVSHYLRSTASQARP